MAVRMGRGHRCRPRGAGHGVPDAAAHKSDAADHEYRYAPEREAAAASTAALRQAPGVEFVTPPLSVGYGRACAGRSGGDGADAAAPGLPSRDRRALCVVGVAFGFGVGVGTGVKVGMSCRRGVAEGDIERGRRRPATWPAWWRSGRRP